MGGGGMAGRVDYPLYMTTIHGVWLTECNLILQAALSGPSPYSGAFAYNPEPDLEAWLDDWSDLKTVVDSYGTAKWSDFVDEATTAVDNTIDDLTVITDATAAYEASQATRLQRAIGRFRAGMADASAALTSAFVLEVGNMEQDNLRDASQLEANQLLARTQRRTSLIFQGTQQLIEMLNNEVEAKQSATGMRGEIAKLTIASQSARLDQELAIAEKDATWDLELFTRPGNLLASISGGIAAAEHTPRTQQAMSNALGMVSALGPLVAAL